MVCTEQVVLDSRAAQGGADVRRQVLVESLRRRYADAVARGDAAAKQALFQEGVYLNIPPEQFVVAS
jgi:hypothetical protein